LVVVALGVVGASIAVLGRDEGVSSSIGETTPPPPSPRPKPKPKPKARLKLTAKHEDAAAGVEAGLKRGAKIAFRTPTRLDVGATAPVVLLFSTRRSIADLRRKVGVATVSANTVGTAVVEYTNEMTARLVGADFSITPVTDERQFVEGGADTRWKWWVEPERAGVLHLTLRLTAHIEYHYSTPEFRAVRYSAPRTIQTFERTLTIRARPESNRDRMLGFAGDNWQWFFTVLILPAGLWALRGWRTRTQPPATPPTPPAA
jgi:hypothetical protein